MNAKCKKEKQDEEVAYAEFSTWCTTEKAQLKDSIQKGAEAIETLSASIGKLGEESKVLGEEITKLQRDVADYEADLKSSKKQREEDHAAFLATEQDYGESVDALERAIQVMQKQDYGRPA